MALLHIGNELMVEIKQENGSGNQNKSKQMQLKNSKDLVRRSSRFS